MPPRSKIDLHGLLERIIEMVQVDKMTLDDVASVLQNEGYNIHKSSIQRSLKKHEDVVKNHQKSLDEAKLLMDTVIATPNTDVIEATNSVLAGKLLEYIKTIDAFDFRDPNKLFSALGELARSQGNMGRLRMEYEKGFDAAKSKFLKSLARELKKEPELLDRLRGIIGGLQAEKNAK